MSRGQLSRAGNEAPLKKRKNNSGPESTPEMSIAEIMKTLQEYLSVNNEGTDSTVKVEESEHHDEKDDKIVELQEQVDILKAELKTSSQSFQAVIAMKNIEIEQLRKKNTEYENKYEEKKDEMQANIKQLVEKIAGNNDFRKECSIKPDFTIRMSLKNCSQKFNNIQCSKYVYHSDMRWRIEASRQDLTEDALSGSLIIQMRAAPANQLNSNRDWSCVVVNTCRLICRTDPTKNRERIGRFITFHQNRSVSGFYFIDWKELTDETNGFIEDDTVLLQVDVQVFP